MKNLKLETQETCTFEDPDCLRKPGLFCYCAEIGRYCFLDSEEKTLTVRDVLRNEITGEVKIECVDSEAQPVSIEYCNINGEVFCSFDTGSVVRIALDNHSRIKSMDVAAFFESGLRCTKLSPDNEITVYVTKDYCVGTMSYDFQILSEVDITSSDFGEKQFVTVGWGKKETQFHGSEGKAAAKVKPSVAHKTDTDNGSTHITWRGDGTLFAVSYVENDNGPRRFKVFDHEGVLQYTSESIDGLEESLAWRPSGNVIASSRKLPNKRVVALFEKNGLLRRDFTLPFETKNVTIRDIIWSRDSDVLILWYVDEETKISTVQLWTEMNYHWYLKQTITYSENNPVLCVAWSSETKSDLWILSAQCSTVYNFYWTVNHSRGKDSSDKAVVGVIDGNMALITGFRDGIVPPPMSQQQLQFDAPINEIFFAPKASKIDCGIDTNDLFCVMHDNRLALCIHNKELDRLSYVHKKTFEIKWKLNESSVQKTSLFELHHFLWFNPNTILCSKSIGKNSALCVLNITDISSLESSQIVVENIEETQGKIEHIVPSINSNIAYIIIDGRVYSWSLDSRLSLVESKMVVSDCFSSESRATVQVEFVDIEGKETMIALTRKKQLYVDGKQVANNVTSFFVHSDFLLLTTLQHTLLSFKLDDVGIKQLQTNDLTVQPWENGHKQQNSELSLRRVERGSILIMAIPHDARTIFEMPRGNLECVQPRALSLAIIGSHIDNLQYHEAFDLMRKQRIDLNLLYDHDPQSFVTNAKKFVTDIDNSSWISLFLSELKEEDVTKSTYYSSYPGRESIVSSEGSEVSKVETVCELLRKILEEKENADSFIQPILISLVKKQKKHGLEDALTRLKKIQVNADGNSTSAEEALKYLLYMVDVNVLYDVALGMYDFDLVMFVAQKSQKDPKEYISFLNELKSLEEDYMKFSIDKHLKRFESALTHIAKIPEKFDECLTFICDHDLYSKGLKLFKIESESYKKIAGTYGKYLASKAKHKEAGIMFTKSGDFREAVDAFKVSGCWQNAIVVALQLNTSVTNLYELYEDLVTRLKDEKRYREAATILEKYLNRPEDSVAVLCEGRKWRDAWASAINMKREDLMETHVKPGVREHAEHIMSQIKQNKENFEKYKLRLEKVRIEMAARELEMKNQLEFETTGDRGISDLLSDTTSVAGSTTTRSSQSSRSTGRSYRSGKNRRKQERKLQSIKEGSAYEDLALIKALYQIITQTYLQRDEVCSVNEMLLTFDNDEIAEQLQNSLREFLSVIEANQWQIWKKDSSKENDNELQRNGMTLKIIEPHMLQPPEMKSCHWQLDMFSAASNTVI